MEKKPWEKPRLMVLTRNRPDESVLTTCKGGNLFTGPDSGENSCTVLLGNCFFCNNRVDS